MNQATLRKLYAALPSRVRGAIPFAFEAWAKEQVLARRACGPDTVAGLEARLWGGFSRGAVSGLEAMAQAAPPAQAAEATWVLSRWRAVQGDFDGALEAMARMRAVDPSSAHDRRQFLLEAMYLSRLGRGAEARALLAVQKPARRFDASRALLQAGTWSAGAGSPDPEQALAAINTVFAHAGLQGVTRRDASRPLSLDNLAGCDPGPKPGAQALISVIVPVHNAQGTILTALRGLAGQSHGNLQVLVVDDASTDGTADVVADFARSDPRFVLIRQATNTGGYGARNRALLQAAGDHLTVHDGDDWSHPQKLEVQLRHLTRGSPAPNFTSWVRVTPDLMFVGPARVYPNLMGLNDSSALFRRAQFESFGAWDSARIAADKELIWRFERLAGRKREAFRRRLILPDCPLSFGRFSTASLTRTGATHVLTVYHGIRREYREAADFWHQGLDRRDIAGNGFHHEPPFFPAPPVTRARRGDAPPLDVLFTGDFNFLGGTQKSALNMIAATRRAGLSAGLLHYRRFDQDVTQPLNPDVRRMALDNGTRVVAPGEELRAGTVVVTYPPVFEQVMDRFPKIDHDHLAVVVNQMAERDLGRTDVAYDPSRVRAHLRELLSSEGQWLPISARVRALMEGDARYPAPMPGTWTPLIDIEAWARAPVWRGKSRARPVLGRHGRDHPLKWPGGEADLRAAWCAGRDCEARFLGGARHARRRLRRWPGNWRDIPFDGQNVRDFLGDLDVFAHYPDASYIEEFGRAPMEAMAAGVPVILPPEFEPAFGEAALYAPPAGVWPLVERLWRDQAFWQARIAAGRDFVAQNCGYDAFPARLAALADP